MGKEQLANLKRRASRQVGTVVKRYIEPHKEQLEKLKKEALRKARRPVEKATVKWIMPNTERWNEAVDYRYQTGAVEKYKELVADGGVPVVYGNHQAHADGVVMAMVSDDLVSFSEGRIKGFGLIIALSLGQGSQNQFLKEALDATHPERHHLELIHLSREKDQKEYNLPANLGEVSREVVRYANSDKGLMTWPEGTLKGGRKQPGGKTENINGMQAFEPGGLPFISRMVERTGKKPFFVPVAGHGTYRFINPNNNFFTWQSIRAFAFPGKFPKFVGVRVGTPITEPELLEHFKVKRLRDIPPADFNEYMELQVARMLPRKAQGELREKLSPRGV